MNASGITGPVGLTALGTFQRSIPGSEILALVRHPGVGPDLTFTFSDTSNPAFIQGAVTVGETNLSAIITLALERDTTDITYRVDCTSSVAVGSPGASLVVFEDKGSDAMRDASLPSLLPSGAFRFAGGLDVNGPIFAAQEFPRRRSVASRLVKVLVEGSSTAQLGGTTGVVFGGTEALNDALSGPITQARYAGLPIDLVYNGAVGGTNSTQILAKLKTDWPTAGALCDMIYLQVGASDLASETYNEATLRANIEAMVLWCANAGKLIALDIPHMINPTTAPESRYDAHVLWCQQLAAEYPLGVVTIVDRYSAISKGNATTPLALMAQDTTPKVHLNCAGALACRPAYDNLAKMLGGYIASSDPYAIGVPVAILTGANATPVTASVTIAADTAAADGRLQWLVTANQDLGVCQINLTGLDTAAEYFVAMDYDLLTVANNSPWVDGVKFTPASGNAMRLGLASVDTGSNAFYAVRTPGLMRGCSLRFKPGAATGTLGFYPGGNGWVCRLRWVALYKVAA